MFDRSLCTDYQPPSEVVDGVRRASHFALIEDFRSHCSVYRHLRNIRARHLPSLASAGLHLWAEDQVAETKGVRMPWGVILSLRTLKRHWTVRRRYGCPNPELFVRHDRPRGKSVERRILQAALGVWQHVA
jgi:hypothetical protein